MRPDVPGAATELELKFLVPAKARAAVRAELARGTASARRVALAAQYLDTPDRRLAAAGLAWRLRREGQRWVQALKGPAMTGQPRFEHEVPRPIAQPDEAAHADTAPGRRLLALLHEARADGVEAGVVFHTDIKRMLRRVRTRGAVVEIAFDEGRILAGGEAEAVHELEFELVSGPVEALLALAERWRARFGLILWPLTKAERGERLAAGPTAAPVRRARRVDYGRRPPLAEAYAAVLDEGFEQVLRNAAGLLDGRAEDRADHVHQLRVGIRRLRSALRSFRGWAPAPPDELLAGWRRWFALLGTARDSDVLGAGVAAALVAAGAPPLRHGVAGTVADPAASVRSPEQQHLLLAWVAWRAALGGANEPVVPDEAPALHRRATKRLRRWHASIAGLSKHFATLDEPALHALRKRIKRQRYAVEFFAPLLRPKAVARYTDRLAAVQDRLGELNDLFVARTRYQALVEADPAAWFALGWLAARIAEARARVAPVLEALAATEPPSH